MTRVLFVGQSYIAGESREKLTHIAATPGYEVFLITPQVWRNHPLGEYHFQPLPPTSRVQAHPLPIHNNGKVFGFFYTPAAVRQALHTIRPDILHIEQEPGSLALLEFILLAHRPPRTQLLVFTWENIAQTRHWLRRLLEQWQLRQINHLFVGNQEAATLFQAKGYRGATTLLPNVGVNAEHFAPTPDPARKAQLGLTAPFIIGYAGRLVPEKGIADLLAAFALLPPHAQLFILGSGPVQAELQQQAQALKIAERVIFHGAVPHQEMPAYLNCLDCLVLPSRTTAQWKEQFGLVLAQAMACGVAVIGSTSGAIPEVIGTAGLTFPEGDVNALTQNLQRLLADPALHASLRAQGRQRVLDHYTHALIAKRTVQIYAALPKPGPSPH